MLPDASVPVRAWFQQVSRQDYATAAGEHASATGSGQVQIRVSGVSGHHGVLQAWFTEPVPEEDVTNRGGRPEYRRNVHYLDASNTECVAEDVRLRRAVRRQARANGQPYMTNEFHLFNGIIDLHPFSEEGRGNRPEGDGPYPLYNVLVEDQDGVLWAGVLTLDEIQERFGEEFREHVDTLRANLRSDRKVYAVYPIIIPTPAVTEEHVEVETETTSTTPSSVGTRFAANPAAAHNSAVRQRRVGSGQRRQRTTTQSGASTLSPPQEMTVYIGREEFLNEEGEVIEVNPMVKCGHTTSTTGQRQDQGSTDRAPRDAQGRRVRYRITHSRDFPARRWGHNTAETEFHARLSHERTHHEVGENGQREWFFANRDDGTRIDHESTTEEREEVYNRAVAVIDEFHAECEEE